MDLRTYLCIFLIFKRLIRLLSLYDFFFLENIKVKYCGNCWSVSFSLTIHITLWTLRNLVGLVYDRDVSHMLPKKFFLGCCITKKAMQVKCVYLTWVRIHWLTCSASDFKLHWRNMKKIFPAGKAKHRMLYVDISVQVLLS